MSQFIACHVTKSDFQTMNYFFLNRNFALKLQGNCWKHDDVVAFSAHLSVTIKRLTRYKQKVVLAAMLEGKSMPSNMAANTNHTNYAVAKRKTEKNSGLYGIFFLFSFCVYKCDDLPSNNSLLRIISQITSINLP